jgi:hypothetical protein
MKKLMIVVMLPFAVFGGVVAGGLPDYDIVKSQCAQQASTAAGITTTTTTSITMTRAGPVQSTSHITSVPFGAVVRKQKFYHACMEASFPNYEIANSQCEQRAIAKVPETGPPSIGLVMARTQVYDPCMKARLNR